MSEKTNRYPNMAKIDAIGDARNRIGEFLEWLTETGRTVSRWREAGNNGEAARYDRWWQEAVSYEEANRRSEAYRRSREARVYHAAPPDGGVLDSDGDRILPWDRFCGNLDYESWEAGYYPEHITIEKLLGEYYGIDLDAYSREQKAMLDEIRARA